MHLIMIITEDCINKPVLKSSVSDIQAVISLVFTSCSTEPRLFCMICILQMCFRPCTQLQTEDLLCGGKHTCRQNTPPACDTAEQDLIFSRNLWIVLLSSEPVPVAPFGSAFASLPPARLVLNQTLSVKAGREFIYQRYFHSSVYPPI